MVENKVAPFSEHGVYANNLITEDSDSNKSSGVARDATGAVVFQIRE